MRKGDFAKLAGVSPAMVTKWAASGLLREGMDGVDAAATLDALAGSFDEPRRLQAIARLQDLAAGIVAAPATKAPDTAITAITARAQKEAIDAQMRRLDLEQRAASLVERQAVEDLLADACRRLSATFDQTRADMIGKMMAIPADAPNRKALLIAESRDRDAAALAAFTADCARIGAEASDTVTLPETDMEHVA
jgi:hypothetical protein